MLTLTSLLIAQHWPFLDEQLVLNRWKRGRSALELLATLQFEAGGESVNLGRKRLVSVCESEGEAGAVWRALVELERRRVVGRQRGSGTRPDAWALRADIGHWRMPWRDSGRSVERALQGCHLCISRALCGIGEETPGPRLTLLRGNEFFRLDHRHHLGLHPPEARGYSARRAATPQSRAWGPVDSRGYSAEFGPSQAPSTVLPVALEELLTATEGAAERYERFKAMIEKRVAPGDKVKPGLAPDQKLMRLAIDITDEVATEARIQWVNEHPPGCRVPSSIDDLDRIGRDSATAQRARAHAAQG